MKRRLVLSSSGSRKGEAEIRDTFLIGSMGTGRRRGAVQPYVSVLYILLYWYSSSVLPTVLSVLLPWGGLIAQAEFSSRRGGGGENLLLYFGVRYKDEKTV